jgi:hypothetical protein
MVVLVSPASTWFRPDATPRIALIAQGFALVGTGVGLFTIAIGVGPRTIPDALYHAVLVGLLVSGLAVAWREHALGDRAG